MRLYHWNKHPNFGDEFNTILWPSLLGDLLTDNGDETLFVGIGTLLNHELPQQPFKVVFGAGAGYGPPPRLDSRFDILCVRGPLTAAALRLPPDCAVTDPALLARKLSWPQTALSSPVVVVPHWQSSTFFDWNELCLDAGLQFLDPCEPPEKVIGAIACARLVLAESLHAAILADAFRVPWIPFTAYHQVDRHKWMDWTATIHRPYEPRVLEAPARDYFIVLTRCERYAQLATGPLAPFRKLRFKFELAAWKKRQTAVRRTFTAALKALSRSNDVFLSSADRSAELFQELERRLDLLRSRYAARPPFAAGHS